jgi:prepilin-type N-terminal cleavage/methylation domain-containing protein
MRTTIRGFTLLELLVVVAIIGFLTTMVLGSLQAARLKAIDAKIQEQVLALRQVMQLEYGDKGTYSAFKVVTGSASGWRNTAAACAASNFPASAYATRVSEICTEIVRLAGPGCGSSCLYFYNVAIPGLPPGNGLGQNNPPDVISIEAYLPGETFEALAGGSTRSRWYCASSFGNASVADGSLWNENGCQQNP